MNRFSKSARSYYDTDNTRDYSKGKSFRYSFDWSPEVCYLNDDYIQDFVSYEGKMYSCIKSNTNIHVTNTEYWFFIMEGQKGDKGDMGTIFVPYVTSTGDISWTNSEGLPNPTTMNITGPIGPKGDTGDSVEMRTTGTAIQWKGVSESTWSDLVALSDIKGEKGAQGERGLPLEFIWNGTQLGLRSPGDKAYQYVDLRGERGFKGDDGIKGDKGDIGFTGPKGDIGATGPSILLRVSSPDSSGVQYLQKKYTIDATWENLLSLEQLRGPRGYSIIVERNLTTNNIEYRYDYELPKDNKILIYKEDIMGPKGDSIAKMFIGDDGYMYVLMNESTTPYRAGYVRGDKGEDGREIVLRIDNDENLDEGESGTGTHLQWKYAGDEYKLWTNLIQINELFNIALSGLKLEYEIVSYPNAQGITTSYERYIISSWKTEYDADGNLVLTEKINNVSHIDIEEKTLLENVYYDELAQELVFVFSSSQGEKTIEVPITNLYGEGAGIEITEVNNRKTINVKIDPTSETVEGEHILEATPVINNAGGLKIKGIVPHLVRDFNLVKDPNTGVYSYEITSVNGSVFSASFPNTSLVVNARYDAATHILYLTFSDGAGGSEEIAINLEELVGVYGPTSNGGLDMTVDGQFYIKELGIIQSMLSEDLQKFLHTHSRIVTYNELLNLKNTGALEFGVTYIMEDYQTIYRSSDDFILGDDRVGQDGKAYPSDVWTMILTALDENNLDENVSIIEHPDIEIRYKIDAFDLCDVENNKGEIYYMRDAWDNECGYDFLNVRWWKSKEELNPSWSNLQIPLLTTITGLYCFTYSQIIDQNSSVNLLSYPNHRVNNSKIGQRLQIPKTDTQSSFKNNVVISQLTSNNNMGSIENYEIIGRDNLIYCERRTYNNRLSGDNNIIMCDQFLNSTLENTYSTHLCTTEWIYNLEIKYATETLLKSTGNIFNLSGSFFTSSIITTAGMLGDTQWCSITASTIESESIIYNKFGTISNSTLQASASIQNMNIPIMFASSIICSTAIAHSTISLSTTTIECNNFIENEIGLIGNSTIECKDFRRNNINRAVEIISVATNKDISDNMFTHLGSIIINNTFKNNSGTTLLATVSQPCTINIEMVGCYFEATDYTDINLSDSIINTYTQLLSDISVFDKRLGKVINGEDAFMLLQYFDNETLTNQTIKILDL